MNVVCIDAGGTSTRVRVTNIAGGVPPMDEEIPSQAAGAPQAAVGALVESGLAFDGLCAGVAGISRAEVRHAWEDALRPLVPEANRRLLPDWRIAVEGALAGEDGILLQAGTGTVAVARRGDNCLRIGGRGWEIGDEGSGSHATTEALRRTMRALDGLAPETRLTRTVAHSLGTTSPDAFGDAFRERWRTHGRGFLMPLLIGEASDGDDESVRLLGGMAGWLARLILSAGTQAGWTDAPPPRIVVSGGMRAADRWIRPPLENLLRRKWPGVALSEPLGSALDGAERIARALLPGNAPRG